MSLKTWIAGEKVQAADLNADFAEVAKNGLLNLVYGEDIDAGEAVCSGYYQADGGIIFDAVASKTGTIASGGGSATQAVTIGNHTNRVLLVVLNTTASSLGEATGVTFNGVAMTRIAHQSYSSGNGFLDIYALFAPDITTANFSFTLPGAGGTQTYSLAAYSYYNVTQAVHLVSSTGVSATTISLNTTPTLDGALILSGLARTSGSFSSIVNSSNNAVNLSTNNTLHTGDSGFVYPKKLTTVSADLGGSNYAALASVALSPITAPTLGVALKASAAALANACNLNKAENFIGFATETKTVGNSGIIRLDGYDDNQSNLQAFSTYYLSNTPGAIDTSAGAISKKVGTAHTTSIIKIKHDNS